MTTNAQINLAAMLDELATRVATGQLGDVSECTVFLQGRASNLIVNLPHEPAPETAKRVERALQWLLTGELPS